MKCALSLRVMGISKYKPLNANSLIQQMGDCNSNIEKQRETALQVLYSRLAGAPCEREGGLRSPEKDSR